MILSVAFQIPLQKTFDYLPPAGVEITEEAVLGRRVLVSFGFKTDIGIVCDIKQTSASDPAKLKPILKFLDEEPLLSTEQLSLAHWLSERYLSSLGEAIFACLPPGKNLKKSVSKTSHFFYDDSSVFGGNSPFVLTPDQDQAVQKVHEAIYNHTPTEFLLYGVAAAGKTEVYMAAIRDVLQQQRTVLYLVPEIGLAAQTAKYLKDRFGHDKVLFWRSDQNPNTRLQDWLQIKSGTYSIVVGPRSTILAPLPDIGLIVVDEEHDSAYKEDRKPRFHVRDVARERARRMKATLIFGSATPSLNIFKPALDGEIQLLELSHRAVSAAAPQMHLVDVKNEKMRGLVSSRLETEIKKRLENHQQIILYLNRRGFHRYLRCPHCSWVFRCENCGIALVEHGKSKKNPAQYQCHYCATKYSPPTACSDCGKKELFAGGYGTQRIEDELKEKFPWAKILRWDRDAASATQTQEDLYRSFLSGDYDILIGTQVVTQGFNFPKVTLVGILDADAPLFFPDYRASERAFQTIVQVAGRAGRDLVAGDVVVQTKNPEHPAIQQALKMDIKKFAEEELKHRDDLNYPPYSHLVELIFTDKKGRPADKEAEQFIETLLSVEFSKPIGVLGPIQSKRKKEGKASTKVVLKISDGISTEVFKKIRESFPTKPTNFSIDVDPESI